MELPWIPPVQPPWRDSNGGKQKRSRQQQKQEQLSELHHAAMQVNSEFSDECRKREKRSRTSRGNSSISVAGSKWFIITDTVGIDNVACRELVLLLGRKAES